ncbi:putative glycosyl group 1 family protein [Golovinomyces cichoracearum]|uniref:Putative glycosyl group 1 family protein n=1 Tax=Golovinomyces cichoracearum TaxID=62708 RepID=A0A420IVI5_9PEZI|nr:putative glycosyl group 1 family protein [Golovinomyces cichoracearum]
MALISSIHAESLHELFQDWWRIVLVGFIVVSASLGVAYQVYLFSNRYRDLKFKFSSGSLNLDINKCFFNASLDFCQYRIEKSTKKPQNFGVYLGKLGKSLTTREAQILSKWDLLVIDPLLPGILEAMYSGKYTFSPQVLARLDLRLISNQNTQTQIVILTKWVTKNIISLHKTTGSQNYFAGICICNWVEVCPISFLKKFIYFLDSLGLLVYIEISSPDFLDEPQLIELEEVNGLIIRNGTIFPNGEQKDPFQMAQMRPTIKTFVSQSCSRSFMILLWETINDDAHPSNAVLRRCYQWSKFYNALPWITRKSALHIIGSTFTYKEPLGAFDWLKNKKVMEIHRKWRLNQSISINYSEIISAHLSQIYAALSIPPEYINNSARKPIDEISFLSTPQIQVSNIDQNHSYASKSGKDSDLSSNYSSNSRSSILYSWISASQILVNKRIISVSPTGTRFDYMGCFPLGFYINSKAFTNVVQLQRHLRKMRLLVEVENSQLNEIGLKLQQFFWDLNDQGVKSNQNWLIYIQALSQQLTHSSGDIFRPVQVFMGLDYGFYYKRNAKFWSVYEFEDDGTLNIYLSVNAHQNMEGVILHTFLSSRGCPRQECFQVELFFAEWSDSLAQPQNLPKRMIEDIDLLTPSELVRFLQDLSFDTVENEPGLVNLIRAAVERKLLDSTDILQLNKMSNTEFLSGRLSPEEIIKARIEWYRRVGCQYPDPTIALETFLRTNTSITKILQRKDIIELEKLTDNLVSIIDIDYFDARVDLIYLSVFCTMRKHAFDETFLEVTDRNILFNDQSDQASAYAELYATGARCETYFDITPNALGKLLSDKFRNYHHQSGHEPPLWISRDSKFLSTYAATKVDVKKDSSIHKLSAIQRFTFLSVFVIPALLDTLLLITTGRGLYLSEFMTPTEQYSATLALMISLLISGAVGTWVTCGGSYYLISMAFSAMNVFVMTRLIGGLAFTLTVGIIGFISLSITEGLWAGYIFFLYLIALTSYLCLLATLANFQYPGSAFLSGRPIIIVLVLFLLISPIISIWISDHDISIYLTVFYTFIILLLLSIRYLGSRWTTWFLGIEFIEDQSLKRWYIERYHNGSEKSLSNIKESGIMNLARDAMTRDVDAAKKKGFWKKVNDPIVKSLVKSYDASVFLLEWYSSYSETPLPIPFSSTWNIQVKVALQKLIQLQTGIRLHNAFIHWRQAGDEVGCNILYFLIALLDKWNAILAGGRVLGLSSANSQHKIPVGFALAYYLIGAVFLDFNATKLHVMTTKSQNMLIGDLKSLPKAVKREVKARRILYWKVLGRYSLFHVWSLVISSCLLWIFQSTEDSTILFMAYVGAYTGLLWYQYTKFFTGPRSLKPLIISVTLGISLGQILRNSFPNFIYSDVTALAVSTWTAAILSLWFARIKTKNTKLKHLKNVDINPSYTQVGEIGVYHTFMDAGKDLSLSQDELRVIFQSMLKVECFHINPHTYSGLQIRSILLDSLRVYRNPEDGLAKFVLRAFPNTVRMLELATMILENDEIILDCVPKITRPDCMKDVKAISFFKNGRLQIKYFYDIDSILEQQSIIKRFFQIAAEVVLHAVSENFMNMSHEDSLLAESLLALGPLIHKPKQLDIPSWVENYHYSPAQSSDKVKSIALFCGYQTLKFLSLGIDLDTQWESLPRNIRELVIKRCLGQENFINKSHYEWLEFNQTNGIQLETYIARCDFGAFITILKRARVISTDYDDVNYLNPNQEILGAPFSMRMIKSSPKISFLRALKYPFSLFYHKFGIFLKLLAISFVADQELQRELDYALKNSNQIIRTVSLFILTEIWNYSKGLQNFIIPLFLLYGRRNIKKFWNHIGDVRISLKSQIIRFEDTEVYSTAFISPKSEDGTFQIHMYSGNLKQAPDDNEKLQRISTYDYKNLSLLRLEEYYQSSRINVYEYEYSDKQSKGRKLSKFSKDRYPIRRKCISGKDEHEEINFSHCGLVESGSYTLHGSIVRFKCYYRKRSNYDDELLCADFILPHLKCTVLWSVPHKSFPEKLEKWIPHSQVMKAIYVLGSKIYESHWIYDHKFHPIIRTTLNGKQIETPEMIRFDYLGVLKKPTKCSFHHDDPLINFKTLHYSAILQFLGLNTHRTRISTSRARSRLWRAWKDVPEFDGVTVRWLDERLLRKEPVLKTYWQQRDHGDLGGAENFLSENADSVIAVADLDSSISGWAPLAIKIADLHSFGQGGDANSRTRSKTPNFDNNNLQVLAMDSGTWPNEGGGVSACRRDMINNLHRVDWYMVSESANDFGLPKNQIIPLWGLDFLTPTHGLFEDRLDTEVEHIPRDMTKLDIKRNFLPILITLVKGARTSSFTSSDFMQITRALVELNAYFSKGKHWSAIWTSTIVKEAWRSLWTSSNLVSPTPSESWFQTEIPTIAQLDEALELWFRHLFIFSIPLPKQIPAIFQASHHSVGASYGIVCKIKRNCILQIWDHAISWREANLYLSSELSTIAPFTRNALLGLMRLTSHLVLHHADIIVPCADFFNPGWEIEIGSNQGSIEHRNFFKRKINPIVNGITDMTRFASIKKIKSERPTVTMLSHIWYAKDIKTAILAADIIVNEWGFEDYRLEIYGAIDKSPSYSMDCLELIASKSLSRFVILCGESDPVTVLEKTWLFMNSSISEGLPLALGEAALTGVPIVCTDVGASLRVLTDPDTGECYSAVVAPNDPRSLARAQINLLALLDEWASYADDPDGYIPPTISEKPNKVEIECITARMYGKTEERKALGMKCRRIVQKSFGGDRYLREHEQMLWICKARYDLNMRLIGSSEMK